MHLLLRCHLYGYNNNGSGDDILTLFNNRNGITGLITLIAGDASVASSLAWSDGPVNWDSARSRPMLGDYNGDGNDDVVIFYDYGNANSAVMTMLNAGTSFDKPRINWLSGAGQWDASRSVAFIR